GSRRRSPRLTTACGLPSIPRSRGMRNHRSRPVGDVPSRDLGLRQLFGGARRVGIRLLDDEVVLALLDDPLDVGALVSRHEREAVDVPAQLLVVAAAHAEALDAGGVAAFAADLEGLRAAQLVVELVDPLVHLAEERLVDADSLALLAQSRGFSFSA